VARSEYNKIHSQLLKASYIKPEAEFNALGKHEGGYQYLVDKACNKVLKDKKNELYHQCKIYSNTMDYAKRACNVLGDIGMDKNIWGVYNWDWDASSRHIHLYHSSIEIVYNEVYGVCQVGLGFKLPYKYPHQALSDEEREEKFNELLDKIK